MTAPSQALRSLALVALMTAWAIAAFFGGSGRGDPDFNAAVGAAPIVAFLAMLLWRARHPLWVAASGLILAGALAWLWPTLRENAPLLYLVEHVGTNLALGALFGRTLVGPGEPLITRFAGLVHPGPLSERKRRYTRQATLAWTLFFGMNSALSALLFALAPHAVWSFYASLLTAPLVGLMFAAEHLWRLHALPPEERPRLADVMRAWRQRASVRNP
ncbi:COG4648 family protein [Thiobacillus sedimenti]|uniref:Transmembrane protein n=1 Tax=Thiobacillus sedimenti TaxID=3110231 RepID=A0ABZ1CJE9_9PROT|nr:hypothetical protein [Thiobacillus sp. SCUT-2]WRS39143.1 hypothetical protein VA613_14205 [Thiobacillus sp. SCUT-2]